LGAFVRDTHRIRIKAEPVGGIEENEYSEFPNKWLFIRKNIPAVETDKTVREKSG
jgi:hypothetical protein